MSEPAAPPPSRPAVGLAGVLAALKPLLGLAIVLGLFAGLLAPRGELDTFLSPRNLSVLLHNSTVAGALALGMLIVIISGGIDLSVGSVVALVTVVTMQAYRLAYGGWIDLAHEWELRILYERYPWAGTHSVVLASLVAVPAGVLAGGVCGLCNGLMITRLRIAPLVATLGMLSVARGVALWLAGRRPITFTGSSQPEWVTRLQTPGAAGTIYDKGLWLRSPLLAIDKTARAVVAVLNDANVWSVLALAALVAVLLRYTVFGRYCYAIGSNEATARLCGVPVRRTKVWVYVLAGLLAGCAGVLTFAHGSSGNPNAGVGLELIVIAAVVIGGASLSGGQGHVFGTLVGVLIWGIIDNGVGFFNADVEVKYILVGAFFIVNTALSQWQRRRVE